MHSSPLHRQRKSRDRTTNRSGSNSKGGSSGGGAGAGGHSPSAGTGGSHSSNTIRDCVCGRGMACVGMTQAFRMLGDPRCYYVELPRYRKDPPAYKYVFRNNLRTAYLRHLAKQNPDHFTMSEFENNPKRRYVALHHFHPTVVRAFYENPLTAAQKHRVPVSITEHEIQQLNIDCNEEDRILSMTGKPTGGYYFVPDYPHQEAHNDLKALIKAERQARDFMSKLHQVARERRAAKNSPGSTPTSAGGGGTPRSSAVTPTSTTNNNDHLIGVQQQQQQQSSVPKDIDISKPTTSSSSSSSSKKTPPEETTAPTAPSSAATSSSAGVEKDQEEEEEEEIVIDPDYSSSDEVYLSEIKKDHDKKENHPHDDSGLSSTAGAAAAINEDDDDDDEELNVNLSEDVDVSFDDIWNETTPTTTTTSQVVTTTSSKLLLDDDTTTNKKENDVVVENEEEPTVVVEMSIETKKEVEIEENENKVPIMEESSIAVQATTTTTNTITAIETLAVEESMDMVEENFVAKDDDDQNVNDDELPVGQLPKDDDNEDDIDNGQEATKPEELPAKEDVVVVEDIQTCTTVETTADNGALQQSKEKSVISITSLVEEEKDKDDKDEDVTSVDEECAKGVAVKQQEEEEEEELHPMVDPSTTDINDGIVASTEDGPGEAGVDDDDDDKVTPSLTTEDVVASSSNEGIQAVETRDEKDDDDDKLTTTVPPPVEEIPSPTDKSKIFTDEEEDTNNNSPCPTTEEDADEPVKAMEDDFLDEVVGTTGGSLDEETTTIENTRDDISPNNVVDDGGGLSSDNVESNDGEIVSNEAPDTKIDTKSSTGTKDMVRHFEKMTMNNTRRSTTQEEISTDAVLPSPVVATEDHSILTDEQSSSAPPAEENPSTTGKEGEKVETGVDPPKPGDSPSLDDEARSPTHEGCNDMNDVSVDVDNDDVGVVKPSLAVDTSIEGLSPDADEDLDPNNLNEEEQDEANEKSLVTTPSRMAVISEDVADADEMVILVDKNASAPNLGVDESVFVTRRGSASDLYSAGDSPGKSVSFSASQEDEEAATEEDETKFDAFAEGTISLNHQLPGADPTLRIQVHNDLIAWESKRRSNLSLVLESTREEWKAAKGVLRDGVEELQVAERLVLGFSKAGMLFADALNAMHEDKFLDNQGNTVTNSFMQNRLMNTRRAKEYSIENGEGQGQTAGQSSLLNSVLESQENMAKIFIESAKHMEAEVMVEASELRIEIQAKANELETVGESILGEMKRSEMEVKKIWDVFDAMVTGDLMEYSVHGSMHGSLHGSNHSYAGSSLHGFLTPRGENEPPMVSSVHSPMVKTTFKQLGGVEDGWLVEMYYRAAVTYQRSVFSVGGNELRNLYKQIVDLEEKRQRRLHEVMLAFVPKQRRLVLGLPEHLNGMLENLVGLRIDEESLESLIDSSIRDRTRSHLRSSFQHKSSIMNRSRLQQDKEETEIEEIESEFGNPFESSLVRDSKVVELKPGGLGGIVNTTWKVALSVITSDGNMHVFELPTSAAATMSSQDAFRLLRPNMNFEDSATWVQGRKADIGRGLTPYQTLDVSKCKMTIANMRKRQFDIVEERSGMEGKSAGSRLLNAANAQLQKCTLRLPSASDTAEWVGILEKTKKDFAGRSNNPAPRQVARKSSLFNNFNM